MKKQKTKLFILSLCAIFSMLSIIFAILVFSRYVFHSDCMGFLLQAKEQASQAKLFPERFHYTTGIFGFTTSVYMLPFVNIIHNDYLLHEIGSIIALLVTVGLVWILFWDRKKIAAIVTLLFCILPSYTYDDMLFFQSAYINTCTLIVLNLIAFKFLLQSFERPEGEKSRNIKLIASIAIYFLVVYFTNYCGISNYMYVELPILGAISIVVWKKYGLNIKQMMSEHKYMVAIIATIGAIIVGRITYSSICARVGFDTTIGTQQGGIISTASIHDVFWRIFPRMLNNFAISSTNSLMSFATIKSLLGFIFFVITIFVSNIYLMKHIKEYDEFNQILIYFSTLLNYGVLFLIFFGGEQEDRYYLPAMFASLINNALFIENVSIKYKKHLGNVIYVLVVFFAFSTHAGFYRDYIAQYGLNVSLQNIVNPQVENYLIDFLDEHELDYGFATFWCSYSNMIASNSRIEIAAYDQGNPLMPYYFDRNNWENLNYYACSEDLYNPELHQGRCFVLVADGETIPEKYYELASEQYRVGAFTALIYEKNIYEIEALREI